MSVARMGPLRCEYRSLTMIPWYRQFLALVFGGGVILITVFAIQQGQGAPLIGSVAGMAFLTLLLIFGVEVDRVEVGDKVLIDFSETARKPTDFDADASDDRGSDQPQIND